MSRRRTIAWSGVVRAIAAVLLGSGAGVAAEPPFDVYVLTGQSNMLGTTGSGDATPTPGDAEDDGRVAFFWSNAMSTTAVFPPKLYGDSGGGLTSLQVQQGDGKANETFWGPEFGFARAVVGRGQTHLLLIKACRGGGSNALWDAATFGRDPNAGHMWGHLRDTVRQPLTAATRDGRRFQVRGLLYLQGESNTADDAARSGERLATLAGNVRRLVEEIQPGAGRGMRTIVAEIAASRATTARMATVAGHRRLADGDASVTFVPTSDLPLKSDGIHFGGDARLEIGRRLAAAALGPDPPPGLPPSP